MRITLLPRQFISRQPNSRQSAMNEQSRFIVQRLANASMFCKVLYAVIFIGYLLSLSDTLFEGLAITPRYLLPPTFWVWTVFTYFLVEKNLIVLLADVVCVHLCGIMLEPVWNTQQLVIYLSVVNASVGVASTFVLFCLYFVVKDVDFLFSTNIFGLVGFSGALLVAVKQILPDSTLVNTPLGRLRNGHLPSLAFIPIVICVACKLIRPIIVVMYIFGAYFGWIYLRFYQVHSNGSKGDMADHFTFASFFPSALQGPISNVSNAIYKILVRLGACQPAIRRFDVSQMQAVTVTLPGTDPGDAERRRQKAIRDLTERLTKAKEGNLSAWPALEEQKEGALPVATPKTGHDPLKHPPFVAHAIPQSAFAELDSAAGKTAELKEEKSEGHQREHQKQQSMLVLTSDAESEYEEARNDSILD